MLLLLQLFIDGLAAGALYALMAVGFAIIYNGTRMLHLAHGAVFTFGGYALYVFLMLLHLPVALGLILAVLVLPADVSDGEGAKRMDAPSPTIVLAHPYESAISPDY